MERFLNFCRNKRLWLAFFFFPTALNTVIEVLSPHRSKIALTYAVPIFFQIDGGIAATSDFVFTILFLLLFLSVKSKKTLFAIYTTVAYVPSFFNIIHFYFFGFSIENTAVEIILNTNLLTAISFVNERINIAIVFILLIYLTMIAFGFFVIMKEYKEHALPKIKKYKLSILLLLAAIIYVGNLPAKKIFIAIKLQIMQLKAIEEDNLNRRHLSGIISKIPKQKQTYVIVIGESVDRKHMSLYGYDRKTTPYFDNMKNELYVFKNPTSICAWTVGSIKAALGIRRDECKNVLHFLKDARFKTFWFSNQ